MTVHVHLAWRSRSGRKPKGNEQGAVEFAHFVGSQFADVVCRSSFFQAHQPIALNSAFGSPRQNLNDTENVQWLLGQGNPPVVTRGLFGKDAGWILMEVQE
jgi:hypothetical protein